MDELAKWKAEKARLVSFVSSSAAAELAVSMHREFTDMDLVHRRLKLLARSAGL